MKHEGIQFKKKKNEAWSMKGKESGVRVIDIVLSIISRIYDN